MTGRRRGVLDPPFEAALARVREGRNDLYAGFHVKHPDLVPLPPESGKCRAETFDGRDRKRCTRPASFLRDGLAVCSQHSRLDVVRAAEAAEVGRRGPNTERARDDRPRLRRHGYGSLPGESIQTLIDAYHEAGSFQGAARLLNDRKVCTRKGGPWSGIVVSAMIRGYPSVTEVSAR